MQSSSLNARWPLVRFALNSTGLLLAVAMLVITAGFLRDGADDAAQYHQAAQNLLSVSDPYATTPGTPDAPPNPNPPLLAYLLTPFAGLPRPLFRLIWFGLNCLWLGLLVGLSLKLVDDRRITAYWGVVAGGVATFVPVLICLMVGQLGMLLALLGVLSFRLAERRPAAAGAALATGAAIKLYPGFLGLFFLMHGPRRVVWWAAGWGVLLLALPLLISGPTPYVSYATKVLFGGFYPYASDFNVSLTGLFSRLFTVNGVFVAVAPAPELARWLSLIANVLVFVACLRIPAGADRFGRLIAFAAWICAMQLITPLNGYYNLPALILPFLTILAALLRYPSAGAAAALALATALLYLRPGWAENDPLLSTALYQGWGALAVTPPLYSSLIYFVLLAWCARRHRRAALTPAPYESS
jgi:hypothetical protein